MRRFEDQGSLVVRDELLFHQVCILWRILLGSDLLTRTTSLHIDRGRQHNELGLYRRHPPLGFVDRAGWLLLKGVECVGVLRSADRLSW